MKQILSKSFLLSLSLLPGLAFAHTPAGEASGFMYGFAHPIGGLDHLLAMVAVGLWAAQIGGKALWLVPCAFVAAMIFGGVLGYAGMPLPFVEEGILVSVLILGVLIAGAFKFPVIFSALLVGFFAIFHGYAHGLEMPLKTDAAGYTFGFALATMMLHMAGMGFGAALKGFNLPSLNRFAGGAIAFGGLFLAVA